MRFKRFSEIFGEDCGLSREEPLLIGFSGGPDSLALLHALHQVGANVVVAHLDHGLRPESAQEARQAEVIASSYGFPRFTERAEISAFAERHSMSIEEAARELRYGFLFRVAEEQGAQAVAVAHNADDQVETVLMHLLRGAGPRGLRGMSMRLLPNPWSETIPLVRPLLSFWRQEILEYCEANGLQPLQDLSNLDTTFFRNRLRHELLPQLDQISPGIKLRLRQTADLLRDESEVVDRLADEAWARCLSSHDHAYIRLHRGAFLDEPLALQRILLRRAAEMLRPDLRDLDYAAVRRALDLVGQPVSAPQDWAIGLYLLNEGEYFWVADWEADLPVDWPQAPAQGVHLEVPAAVELNLGWRFELQEAVPVRSKAEQNQDPFEAWLDRDRVGDDLVLRRRHPGDRIQPLGMDDGSLKLADFMVNEKMPKRARDGWPLLCKNGEIIWMPGYRLAHPYRLRDDTNRAIHVSLQRSNGRV